MDQPHLIALVSLSVMLAPNAATAHPDEGPFIMSKDGLGLELILGGGQDQIESEEVPWARKGRFAIEAQTRYRVASRWSVGLGVGRDRLAMDAHIGHSAVGRC